MNNHPRDFDRRTLSMAVFALSLSLAMPPFLSCVGEEFDLCDVDMASLEGSYYFSWQAHEIRYYNTCFDYGGEDHDPPSDPADMTDCEWKSYTDLESRSVEVEINADGSVGDAKVTADNIDADRVDVHCELLEEKICNAKIRCTLSGTRRSGSGDDGAGGQYEEWQYDCRCTGSIGDPDDPDGSVCQSCKAEWEQYDSEKAKYDLREEEETYYEFELTVLE